MRFEDWWKLPQVQAKFCGQGEVARAAWDASALFIAELLGEISSDVVKSIKQPSQKQSEIAACSLISVNVSALQVQKHRIGRWPFRTSEAWKMIGPDLHHPSGWRVLVSRISEPTIARATKESGQYTLFTASVRSDEWIAERWMCNEIVRCNNPIQAAVNFVEGKL